MIATRKELSTAKRSTGLAMLERACKALEHVRTIDDVTPLISVAEAARVVFKKAKAGVETMNLAAEVKLRCERKAGELLARMDKQNGRPSKNGSIVEPFTLEEIGINKKQSHRWQRIAGVAENVFEAHLSEFKEAAKEITTAAVLRLANEKREPKPLTAHQAMWRVRRFVEQAAVDWPTDLSKLSHHLRALADEIDSGTLLEPD